MLAKLDIYRASWFALLLAAATIGGAWIFEWAGYAPCELCLQQRYAYYIGVPLAALAVAAATMDVPRMARLLLIALAIVFAASAVFGVYHSGVEWGFWPGPSGCAGGGASAAKPSPADMGDFLKQLKTTRVVPCTEAAIRIFGLSLAGWNAVISAVICTLALKGVRRDKF